jgi:hypothetical protein
MQHSLDDYVAPLANNARDTGMSASKGADPDYVSDVLEWIYCLPIGYRFTSDLVRSVHGPSRAAGGVINTARNRGWIVSVALARSKSLTRHGGLCLEWERTVA